MKRKEVLELATIAYYSGLDGVEIKSIEYGIDDYIICVSGAWRSKKNVHRVKIYYSDKGDYFKVNGYKIPLNECIKC